MRLFFPGVRQQHFMLMVFIGIVGSLCATGVPQLAPARNVLKWDKVLEAYDAYVDYPCPDNARALLTALPEDRLFEKSGDASSALNHIFSIDNFPILYEEAISGDRIAIEIFFRLLNVSDGYYSELVMSTLGWFVRDRPQIFLELLTSYKDINHIKTQGYPVGFVGSGHNVHIKAARYILEKRIEALETVKDPKYAEIKEACIKKLRETINGYTR